METKSPYTIALVQMRCTASPEENLAIAETRIRSATASGAQVVCLPELFRSPYFCKSEDASHFELSEPIPGATTEHLCRVARECGVVVLAPVFERRAAGLYHNTVAVIDADGVLLDRYRKMHIPDDPGYYEKFYFTPGDLGFKAVSTAHGRLGILICWDQWFPEAARLTALQGAQVIFYPTAIGWLPEEKATSGDRQVEAWRTAQRAHAIANGIYVAAANRVGHEDGPKDGPGIEFWGSSFICDPMGHVLTEAPVDDEAIIIAKVDPGLLEDTRREWPFLRDRRIDAYQGLTERFVD